MGGLLGAARSHAWHQRERSLAGAPPPRAVRDRALLGRRSGLAERSREGVHQVRRARPHGSEDRTPVSGRVPHLVLLQGEPEVRFLGPFRSGRIPFDGYESALRSLIVYLVCAASIAGCSRSLPEGDALYLALETSPNRLDPPFVVDVAEGQICSLIYQGLVRFSPQGEVIPDAARSWEIQNSGTRYVFRLDTRARFSDGGRLAARDVVWSFERVLSPASRSPRKWVLDRIRGAGGFSAGSAASIEGLAAPDDSTVVIELERPFRPFLDLLAMPAAYIVKTGPRFLPSAPGCERGLGGGRARGVGALGAVEMGEGRFSRAGAESVLSVRPSARSSRRLPRDPRGVHTYRRVRIGHARRAPHPAGGARPVSRRPDEQTAHPIAAGAPRDLRRSQQPKGSAS